MTPLVVAVAVATGCVAVVAPRLPALRSVPGGAAFASWSALGTGLATSLAAGLLPDLPGAVALVAVLCVVLDLAGLAVLAASEPSGRTWRGLAGADGVDDEPRGSGAWCSRAGDERARKDAG